MTDPDKPEQSPTDPSSSAPPPPPGPPPGYQYGAQPGAYPPPPPPPYGGYPYAQGAPTAPKNGIGIASLVVAIIGLFTVFGGIVLGVAAIVLGFVGRGRAKRGEATNGGIATAGIVLGFLGVIVSIVAIALSIWGFSELGGADLVDCLQRAGNDVEAQQQCEEDFTNNMEDQFSVTLTPTATP